jgi:hypothetical protein
MDQLLSHLHHSQQPGYPPAFSKPSNRTFQGPCGRSSLDCSSTSITGQVVSVVACAQPSDCSNIRSYKAQYLNLRLKDIAIRNPAYPAIAKVFYVPGQFYEYVTNMNPGPAKPVIFSVSMNSQKSEATAKQLGAYESTLASLKLLKP